jgi:hypothetical protein
MGQEAIKRVTYPPKEVRLVPVTEGSYPLCAANRQLIPYDLEAVGYVEEEYFVGGTANIYTWQKDQKYPDIKLPDAPYMSRVLVRKPKDMKAFSVLVHVI